MTTNCSQLKLQSKDGKYYNLDVLDIEGILRLIDLLRDNMADVEAAPTDLGEIATRELAKIIN